VSGAAPLASVVIPTLDAGPEFTHTLAAVRAQAGVGEVELIVLDSESRDRTVELAWEAGARVRRIVRSLRDEIVDAGSDGLRIRRVFTNPREIYRVELERPGLAYQRTTLLDRAALEELLAQEEVRSRLRGSPLAG